jgi:hypothetical protein
MTHNTNDSQQFKEKQMSQKGRICPLTLVFALSLINVGCISQLPQSDIPDPRPSSTIDQSKPTSLAASNRNPISVALPGGNRVDSDPLELLQNPQIKAELGMTDDQSTQLKKVTQEFRKELKPLTDKLKDVKDPSQLEVKKQEVGPALQQREKAFQEKVRAILKPEQIKRSQQIFLQIFGWGPMTQKDFDDELQLTGEQKKKLDDIREQMVQRMQSTWEAPAGAEQPSEQAISSNRERMENISKDANERSWNVLTEQQRRTLETLKGKPFKFDRVQVPKS